MHLIPVCAETEYCFQDKLGFTEVNSRKRNALVDPGCKTAVSKEEPNASRGKKRKHVATSPEKQEVSFKKPKVTPDANRTFRNEDDDDVMYLP